MKRLVFRKGKVLGSNRIRIGNRPKNLFVVLMMMLAWKHAQGTESLLVQKCTHTHIHTHECMVWLIVAQAAIFLWNNDEKQRAGRNGPFTQQRNAYMRMAMLRFHFA